MDEQNTRKGEIDTLLDRMVEPDLPRSMFDSLLRRRAELIREEAEDQGIHLDDERE